MLKVWGDQSTRYLNAAMHKWKYGKHAEDGESLEDKYNILGAGGKLLIRSERYVCKRAKRAGCENENEERSDEFCCRVVASLLANRSAC